MVTLWPTDTRETESDVSKFTEFKLKEWFGVSYLAKMLKQQRMRVLNQLTCSVKASDTSSCDEYVEGLGMSSIPVLWGFNGHDDVTPARI